MFEESAKLLVWLIPVVLLAVIILPQMITASKTTGINQRGCGGVGVDRDRIYSALGNLELGLIVFGPRTHGVLLRDLNRRWQSKKDDLWPPGEGVKPRTQVRAQYGNPSK